MIAAVYIRVSTEDQARFGYSLEAQLDSCRQRAVKLGATVVREFADEGISGSLLSRPGLDALRETVRDRAIDLVVIWDPDRLSRTLSHQLLIADEIEQARVRLEFVNFEWRDTPEGQLFYAMRGAIAQYEKEKIKERTSRGRQQKAKQGKLPLALRPYGYDYDSNLSQLTVNRSEASIVRAIFRWMVAEGEGPLAIATRLNQLSIPAKKGGLWSRSVVRQILLNRVYTGVLYVNRWDTTDCSLNRHRPKGDRVRASLRPESDWIPLQVPALIDEAMWHEVAAIMSCSRRLWAGKPRADYLLSGLLSCGSCHMSMSGFTGKDWGRPKRKYTCRRSHGGAAALSCGSTVPAEALERAVWKAVCEWLSDPAKLWEAMDRPDGAGQLREDLIQLERAIQQAERTRRNILTLLEQGFLGAVEAGEALQRAQERIQTLSDRRRSAEESLGRADHGEAARSQWQRLASETLDRFKAGDLPNDEQRALIRTLVTRVEVGDQRLTLHAKWPPAFDNVVPEELEQVSAQDLGSTSKS